MALTKISGEVIQQPLNVGVITASGINATGLSTLGITSATTLYVAGVSTISVNSSTDALRITQTGSGNALVVEDAANPDDTPFVITTGGNVAIGTLSPNSNAILDIAPAASATVRVHSRTNVVPVTSLELLTGENETWGTDASTDFRFKNNATDLSLEIGKSGVTTESVRVFSTGEVGIGTTISTSGSKLQVVGNAYISGRLGIGTTNPTVPLDVFKTSFPEINLKTGTITATFGIDTSFNTFVVGSTTNHPFTLRTNGTDRLYLTSGGNVGIATTNPSEKLHLVGKGIFGSGSAGRSQSFADGIHIQPTSTNATVVTGLCIGNDGSGSGTGGAIALGAGNAAASTAAFVEGFFDGTGTTFTVKTSPSFGVSAAIERLRIDNNGRLGIGTTNPTLNSKVEIFGTDANLQVHFTNNTRGGIAALLNQRLAIYTTAAADHIVFGRSTTDATAISGTNFTEHVRINNTTGNTGIGTNNPSNKLHLYGTSDATELLQFEIGGQPASAEKGRMIWRATQSNGQSAKLAIISGGSVSNWGGDLRFYTKPANGSPDDNNTLRMSILSSGEFRIGSSDLTSISTDPAHTIGDVSQSSVQTNLARLMMQERVSNWISFKNGGGTHFGTIAVSGAGVNYGSNSDYRLKENVIPLSGSIQKIKALKPVTFNFIDRPENIVDGFLAHEVQEVTPYAVTGEKDGYDISGDVLDSDGNIVKKLVPEPEELEEGQTWVETSRDVKIQQLDPAKLVPVLTAALQEALAKIETLEARLDAAGL